MAEAIATYLVEEYAFNQVVASVVAYGTVIYASSVVSQKLNQQDLGGALPSQSNPGSRAQVPPAGSNKLPVVYGSAYVGGIITDLSITSDNQTLYFVIALSEVTNTETGGSPDTFSFGDIYWGGKKCNMTGARVNSLLDESTGLTDSTIDGKLFIYTFRNGSSSGVNTSLTAVQIMQESGLTYTWDSNKLMSNCAFAIVKMVYSYSAGLTSLQQTRFQLTNSRRDIGDCFLDYMTSTRYGAAIPSSQIDTSSLTDLTTYGNQSITYTDSNGNPATQARFKFDGVVDTTQTIMQNLQMMAASCDCLLKYNEIQSKWGVIVQSPDKPVVMDLNDSNMVSSINVTPIDVSNSYNVVECKYPDGSVKDSFNSVTYDLAQIAPSLLFNNEPVNKQSINLNLVNNDVRVQMLAYRFLKAAREDLQIQCKINYSGIQLEAGDVVTVTNTNYGWTAKPFRVLKVTEVFDGDGNITAQLNLSEYNATVYDDASVSQFIPAPNTGIGDPSFFGSLYAPSIVNSQPNITNPSFGVNVTCSSSGIVQYAEIWYSAFASPTSSQLIFAGTTDVNPAGNPFTPSASMGVVTLANIPAGDWYFFVKMVNSLGSSGFSSPSSVFRWRPSTFQYSERYLIVAYADDVNGTNLSSSPIGKYYYGLLNSNATNFSTNPSDYKWYLADPAFGTSVKLLYCNRTGRKFSFATGFAGYAGGSAAYVPTQTAIYDPSIWGALADGINYIDLDVRSGQLIETGTTTIGSGEIAITNNADGKVVASLATLLDFGTGVQTLTGSAASITIDIYGRVLGFTSPDLFYYTMYNAVATASQTVFTPTARQANYITGCDWVFKNGSLLDTSEYTENSTTVTLGTGATSGDKICIISVRAIAQGNAYINSNMIVQSVATSVVTYNSANLPFQQVYAGDIHTFVNSGTPTQYTVSSYNAATRQITYTTTVSGVSAGAVIYVYRANGSSYRPFSRWTASLSAASSYTPTTFAMDSGYEKLFLNGASVNDQDYDLVSGAITNFPASATGNLTIIQFADSNLTAPIGNQTSQATNTVVGQSSYVFNYNANAFELYYNGALQVPTSDYTFPSSNTYTLASTPTSTLGILQQTTYQRTGAA